MEENGFTVLENKTIGRNMALYRKIRGIKALEVAEGLGLKEASYTRYERGEAAITVDIVQKVAEILKVDPLTLLSVQPSTFIENGNNSPNSANGYFYYHGADKELLQAVTKLMENMMSISQKLVELLDRNK